jgi:hypothetical protein
MIKKLFFHIPSSAPWRRGASHLVRPDWANFRLLGDCFLRSGFVNYRICPHLRATFFSSVKSDAFIFSQNVLGYILSELFTNSSGHTDRIRLRKKDLSSNPAMALGFEGKHDDAAV